MIAERLYDKSKDADACTTFASHLVAACTTAELTVWNRGTELLQNMFSLQAMLTHPVEQGA